MATFYLRFIKGFNIIMAQITDCLKKEEFQWSAIAAKAFKEIKQRMIEVPVMRLPDFSKAFEVMCDASGIDIGGVLSQERHLIAFFSEKLSGAKLNYFTYHKEFYVIVQSLCYWRPYLLP